MFGNTGQQVPNTQPTFAFRRGLFGANPQQVEKKATAQRSYQQQLKRQMDQNKRRKDQQKRKFEQEDIRLERKIKEQELIDQQRRKNDKTYKTFQTQNHKQNNQKQQGRQNQIPYNRKIPQQHKKKHEYSYKTQIDQNFKQRSEIEPETQKFHYQPRYTRNPNEQQEDRLLTQQRKQRERFDKESLDMKIAEIHKQIQQSKKVLKINQQLQRIRRLIKGPGEDLNRQRMDQSKFNYFTEEYSEHYLVPKIYKQSNSGRPQRSQPKKLQENSRLRFQKNAEYVLSQSGQRNINLSANLKKRGQQTNSSRDNLNKWGAIQKQGRFLGNRQALDYKIDSMMEQINNILDR